MSISAIASSAAPPPKGREQAAVFRDYFDLQLSFAETYAARSATALADAITYQTNLHRRFGYGHLGRAAPADEFVALVQRVVQTHDVAARRELVLAAYAERPEETPPVDSYHFGCFGCDAPSARGHIHIHFANLDSRDGTSPLATEKVAARQAELKALVRFIAAEWPQAAAIDGTSWLYNTRSYRRLFPPAFADSRRPRSGPRTLHGSATWAQFLDFRGRVKADLAATFRKNLELLDPAEPWRAFPLEALQTSAPLQVFRQHFGV